jgi:DNA polymerase-3 subunit epsilon
MSKVLWIDLETTGLDPKKHGIIQLAALAEIDNDVVEEVDLLIRPLDKHQVEEEALAKSNRTEKEVREYPTSAEQFKAFETFLARYINRYDKFDKFVLAGYNINSFDEPFLRQFFIDNAKTDKERKYGGYFGSWFFWPKRDVQTYLAEHLLEIGLRLSNYQLSTVCEYFNIPIEAHDALSDIQATRILYNVLRFSIKV